MTALFKEANIDMQQSGMLLQDILNECPSKAQPDFAQIISDICPILQKSILAKQLIKSCRKQHVKFATDPYLYHGQSNFYPFENTVDLPEMTYHPKMAKQLDVEFLCAMISGMRMAWHHHFGNPLKYQLKPKSFVKYYRFIAADIEAVTTAVFWELRHRHHPQIWRQYLSSANGDIAEIYAENVSQSPENQYNGEAIYLAFQQFFKDQERVTETDHEALEYLDMILLDFEKAADMNKQSLLTNDLEKIGRLPNGSYYLKARDLQNPIYSDMNDVINQAHLQHIMGDIRAQKSNLDG